MGSTPQDAIDTFLTAYPAWGRFTQTHLADCKHLAVKNKLYKGVVVTCKKKAYNLPVEGEFLRFFLTKETEQRYHLIKVKADWHRSHENNQSIQFKHREETLWALLQSKRQDLNQTKTTWKKALRWNLTQRRYEPIWTGLAAPKIGVRMWQILVDDTTDKMEMFPAGQESGHFQGQLSAHVVTPASARFSNAQGEFGYQSQVCRLGDVYVEERYVGCSCENQPWSSEQTNNEDAPSSHGWLSMPRDLGRL
jgi:hypothetical protein